MMQGKTVPAIVGLSIGLATLAGCKGKEQAAATPPASTAQQPAEAAFQVDPATAASIHGVVKYMGPKPKPQLVDMSGDPLCVKAHGGKQYDESLLVNGKGDLANAFVYISSGLQGKHFAVPSTPVTIEQKGCWFHPRVLGVQVGQPVDVVNSDPVTHNIHFMPKDSREWNHSQGPGDAPMHHTFLHAELGIPIKCNIHSWMHAYVNVVDSPYFAVTDADGSFNLPNLPPGTYTVTAWHEGMAMENATVTVAPKGSGTVDLTFHGK